MEPGGFLADIEQVPETLSRLARALEVGDLALAAVPTEPARVLMLGMGSSGYAAGVVAARLRAAGVAAVADLASSSLLPPAHPGLLVIAVSASGESAETVAAVRQYRGVSTVVAVTEEPGSALAEGADVVVPLLAGREEGGVACRSYRHTLAVLLAIAERLSAGVAPDVPGSCRRAAAATAVLLGSRQGWLPEVADALDGPSGSWVVAPAARLASAQQSALMLREGPRRPSQACESGDWSHVDVYLTKTVDYRMLLMPGSAWDGELLRWTAERAPTVVAVGAPVPGARCCLGYDGYLDDDVALLTETTVAELVAQRWWAASVP
jgi:glutamine---fructose-6-phosphate transaminase (isomerizing)